MAVTNINGANGITSDPRESIMWDIYVTNLSKGIENAYAAAIQATYSEDSARNVTMRDWFKERLGKLKRKEMLSKAERNLHKVLDMNYVTITETGEEKTNTDILRVVVDVSKTITASLGKNDGYSTRSEVTGADGEQLNLGVIILPTKNGEDTTE